jgi:hypothetical protein
VTQEIALAQHAITIAGSKAMDLRLAITMVGDQNSPFQYISNYILDQTRSTQRENWGLLNILHHFRRTACMVPRDRIYSLLALCNEGVRYMVDYEI